jgi:hypothetical protein
MSDVRDQKIPLSQRFLDCLAQQAAAVTAAAGSFLLARLASAALAAIAA